MAQSSSPRPQPVLKGPSPQPSQGISPVLERRGIKLPPIFTDFTDFTDFHDGMPKQQGWSHGGGHLSTAGFLKVQVQEISKWSDSSSEHSTDERTSNAANDNKFASSNEPESPFDASETIEQRLARWQKFYAEKSMEDCTETDEYGEYLMEELFVKLYQEVQYTVDETESLEHRGQQQVRLFWDDVRAQLRDDEESEVEWPPTEEVKHCTAWMYEYNPSSDFIPEQRPVSRLVAGQDDFRIRTARSESPPLRTEAAPAKSTVTVEDAELQEIREWLMNRKRMRAKMARLSRLGQ